MELLTKQMICHTAADPEAFPDLPSEVDNFTGLCPLEPPPASPAVNNVGPGRPDSPAGRSAKMATSSASEGDSAMSQVSSLFQ